MGRRASLNPCPLGSLPGLSLAARNVAVPSLHSSQAPGQPSWRRGGAMLGAGYEELNSCYNPPLDPTLLP